MVKVKFSRYLKFLNFERYCTVATQLTWGGRHRKNSYRISLGICQWKNFEKRSAFAEILIKSQVYCFLDTVYIIQQNVDIWTTSCRAKCRESSVAGVLRRRRILGDNSLALLPLRNSSKLGKDMHNEKRQ